ncbi:MAG: HAMP domain-containing sensor histidine kinase [Bacteroidia bacterium]|nr:HAMP domain-containing sensor histidine kinase [Bacteroidia bacterium]
MKLLTKTNIYTSIATALLFALGVFVVYQVIKLKLDRDVDEQLLSTKNKIIKGLKEGIPPKEFLSNIGQKIYVKEIYRQMIFDNRFVEYVEEKIDYKTGKKNDDDIITQRELLFQTKARDKIYEVTVCISLLEGQKMGEYIIGVVLIFLIVSIFFLFLLNRYISAFIWSPFYDTLSNIKTWNIKKSARLEFKPTDIDEFHLLNDTVKDLTQQIQLDYYNLKEFTENVSHEAQTPLSIISAKLELLLQQSNYSEKQHEHLLQAYRATQRMYKLNEALILLTRIENKQFIDKNTIDLTDAIEEKLDVLADFIEAKNITIKKEYNKVIKKEVNPVLLTILLNNLFINAIKYNIADQGCIRIMIDENSFAIENSSPLEKIDKQFMFERFKKDSTSGSLGVGLSLIKKVVDFFNWQITYSYKDGLHRFKIYM